MEESKSLCISAEMHLQRVGVENGPSRLLHANLTPGPVVGREVNASCAFARVALREKGVEHAG